mmetsp:Transcript_30277/g.77203  ORF Transcript_30277/g.77203 Transcript_30277/m.77203 type:complete len:1034 (-) Transcript_30277:1092-4193(-)
MHGAGSAAWLAALSGSTPAPPSRAQPAPGSGRAWPFLLQTPYRLSSCCSSCTLAQPSLAGQQRGQDGAHVPHLGRAAGAALLGAALLAALAVILLVRAARGGHAVHDGRVQLELALRDVVDVAVNGAVGDHAVHGDGARLAQAMAAVLRLLVDLRVEVDVVQDDGVRPHQVQALAARARGQQEHKHALARVVELVHDGQPVLHLRRAVQAHVLVPLVRHEPLQHVEHLRPLREQQHAAALGLELRQQLRQHLHLARVEHVLGAQRVLAQHAVVGLAERVQHVVRPPRHLLLHAVERALAAKQLVVGGELHHGLELVVVVRVAHEQRVQRHLAQVREDVGDTLRAERGDQRGRRGPRRAAAARRRAAGSRAAVARSVGGRARVRRCGASRAVLGTHAVLASHRLLAPAPAPRRGGCGGLGGGGRGHLGAHVVDGGGVQVRLPLGHLHLLEDVALGHQLARHLGLEAAQDKGRQQRAHALRLLRVRVLAAVLLALLAARARLGRAAQAQVQVVAPARALQLRLVQLAGRCGRCGRAAALGRLHRLALGRQRLKEALGHGEQRPVVLLEDGRGWHEQRGGGGQVRQVGQRLPQPLRVLLQPVHRRRHVRQRRLARLLQDAHLLAHVAQVQRVLEAPHHVAAHLCDLEHLAQLLQVAGDEVQEGQALKRLGLLVRELHDLVVALAQRLHAQLVPRVLVVQLLRALQRHLNVAALHRQVEARALVLHKVQRHLGEALLLQVADDGGAAQAAALDHGDDLVVLALQQRQLEQVLGHVHLDLAVLALAVQRKHHAARHLGDVQRHVQRADDAAVAVGQAVLDVVERGVHQHAVVVPRGALDADGLVHRLRVLQLLVRNDDGVLGQQRDHGHVVVPHHVLDRGRGQLRQRGALLHVKQRHLVLRAAQQHAGARVEHGVRGGAGRRALLGDLVLQVADLDGVGRLVQHRKAVACDEHRGRALPALGLRRGVPARALLGDHVQLVRPALRIRRDKQRALRRVVRQRLGARVGARAARAPDGDERVVALRLEVVGAQVPVLDVV